MTSSRAASAKRAASTRATPAPARSRTGASGRKPGRPRGPGRPVDGDSAATRQQLIDAAIECFGARGLARTTLRDIALRAGLTTGTLYHHFATKEALYTEAYQCSVEKVYQELEESIAGKESLADRLAAAIDTQARLTTDGTPFSHFILRAWVEHGEEGAIPLPIPARVEKVLNALVDDAVAKREVRDADREEVMNVARACMWGVMAISLTGPGNVPSTADGLKRMVRGTLYELQPAAATARRRAR
ncbi:MAG: TetR/AcrR family transcriptional regulator [Acidimicrobiia bacterium]